MTDGRPPRTPLVIRLVFMTALVFTLVGIVELGFVGYDWFTGGSLSRLRAPDLERGIRSWTTHHAMRPGYSDSPSAVPLNSFGLRSPEVAVPKPAGTKRILLLGDSFTFGFKVGEQQGFPRRLEASLRVRQPDASIEVVNAGVISYCPLLEYLQYRHHLHVLEPDLVILNFDMSDVQDHLLYSRALTRSPDGVPLFVTEPSLGQGASAMPGLLSFEWVERKVNAAVQRFRSAREDSPFARDLDRYLWTFDDGPPLEDAAREAMAPIAELKRLLAHDGIPLVLATYPQPWQVAAEATPGGTIRGQYGVGEHAVHLNDRPFRMLEAFAAEQGMPFVNATEAFRDADDSAGLFMEADFHFTPRGHQLYADVLAEYLEAHRAAPAVGP